MYHDHSHKSPPVKAQRKTRSRITRTSASDRRIWGNPRVVTGGLRRSGSTGAARLAGLELVDQGQRRYDGTLSNLLDNPLIIMIY